MLQSPVLLCWKKKWEEGNEAWQAYWKESSFLWTDRHTKCQGKKLSKGLTKRARMATLLYYIYKLCRCTYSAGRKQGKWKTWYYCTMEPQLSMDQWSMEKTSNKTQHHDCHGTTVFISSGRAILIDIHPPTTSAGDKNLDWAFSLYTNCGAEHSYLLWKYSGHQSTVIWKDPLTGCFFPSCN